MSGKNYFMSLEDWMRAAAQNESEGVTVSDEVEDVLAYYTKLVTAAKADPRQVNSDYLKHVSMSKRSPRHNVERGDPNKQSNHC